MDFIATVLGLQLPTLKARDSLRENYNNFPSRATASEDKIVVWGCDLDNMWRLPEKTQCDDDETASTLSDCDASFSSSSESLGGSCVTFASCLVTEVHLRPCTERSERQHLYYNEMDFRRFRMEYRQSLYRKRPSVTFSSSVVSHIHALPAVDNKQDVYYSSSELKQ